MAGTDKRIDTTVVTKFDAINVDQVQKSMQAILDVVNKLPDTTKRADGTIKSLIEGIRKVNQAVAEGQTGNADWLSGMKEVQNILRSINLSKSALKLFDDNQITKIREVTNAVSASAKAIREFQFAQGVVSGTTGNGANTKQLDSYLKKLQEIRTVLAAPKRQGGQSEYLGVSLQQADAEISRLTKMRQEVDALEAARKEAARQEANRQKGSQQGYDAAQRGYERAQGRAQFAATPEGQAAAEAKSREETMRNLQARLKLSTGEGAASLLLIQGALMANATVLNAITGAFSAAIGFSVQFEAALRNVQAVVGTTNGEMGELQSTIMKVATNTKFGTLEVAEAALSLGQAGLTVKQINDSLASVVTLATASGTTIANAVDLVTSVIGVFDKGAGDVADVANKITQAANGSRVSVEKLALGFQYAGNTASQLGISFEEVTAAMAAMSNAGIKSGSTMGTGLRQFLVEVQKPSEDFIKIMTRLGLTMDDLDFKSKGFAGVLQTLRDAGFVASDAISSFDVRGAAAFNALLARPDDFNNQLQSLSNSTAAMKANEIQMNSLSAQGSRLVNVLGNLVSTGLEPTTQGLTQVTRLLGDMLSSVTENTTALAIMGTVLAGLVGGAVFFGIAQLAAGIASVISLLATMATGATVAGVALGSIAAVSGVVGLAIAAVAGGYALYKANVEDATTAVEKATEGFNRAKGAAQEKEEALRLLDNRIDLLSARENTLRGDSEAMSRQFDEAKEAMAKMGFQVDSSSSSFDGLLSRLREVRSELKQLQALDMSIALNKAVEKVSSLTRLQEEQKDKLKGGFFRENLSSALDPNKMTPTGPNNALLNSIKDPKDREIAIQAGRDLNANKLDSVALAQLSSILDRNRGNMNGDSRGTADNLMKSITDLQITTKDLLAATVERDSIDKSKRGGALFDRTADVLKDRFGLDLQGLSSKSESLVPNARKTLLESGGATDEVSVNRQVQADLAVERKRVEGIVDKARQIARELGGSEADVLGVISRINTLGTQRESALGEGYRKDTDQAKASLKANYPKQLNDATMDLINARISGKRMQPGDEDRGIEILRAQNKNKFDSETLGMELNSPTYKVMAESSKATLEVEITKFREKVQASLRQIGSQQANLESKGWQAMADAEMRQAKASRSRASGQMDLEQISDLMDDGLGHIAKAKEYEVKALNERIERDRGKGNVSKEVEQSFQNQRDALNEKYDAATQQYLATYTGVIQNSIKVFYDLATKIKSIDARIKAVTNESTDRLYAGDAAIRSSDITNSINNGSVSGLRRTEVDKFYSAREREQLDLNQVIRQQTENTLKMAQAGALRTELQGSLDKSRTGLSDAQATKAEILSRNGGDQGTITNSADLSKLKEVDEVITQLTKDVPDGEKKIEDLTKRIYDLRDAASALDARRAGLEPSPEAALNVENFNAALERSLDVYAKMVDRQDTFKILEDGAVGALGGVQSAFANAATEIVTRTNTIGGAFRSMAANIIKSMLQVLSQALALQAVKGILGMFMGGGSPLAGTTGGADYSLTSVASSSGLGLKLPGMATGGIVGGGIQGKDSVPTMLMPGEGVLNTKAVRAVGEDFVHALNSQSDAAVTRSSSLASKAATAKTADGGTVNVYVVSPDQAQGMGPNDVVVTMTQDMMNNGPFKKLVKQVAVGTL